MVEAALRSGSLISARLAGHEGREVMALPGQVSSKHAKGCHQLLKDGATLIESAQDVLRELGLEPGEVLQTFQEVKQLTPEQHQLLNLVSTEARTIAHYRLKRSYPLKP